MKKLHNFTKDLSLGPNLAGANPHFFYDSPMAMIEARSKPWYERWARDQYQINHGTLNQALVRLHTASLREDALPAATPHGLRNTLSLIKSNRGLGLDHHRSGDLKELPLDAFRELAEIFEGVNQVGIWPFNETLIPIGLIEKPDGGDRPIGITPVLAALYLKNQHGEIVMDWEEKRMVFWEDAIRGSSALRAGLRRRLFRRMRHRNGQKHRLDFLGPGEILRQYRLGPRD